MKKLRLNAFEMKGLRKILQVSSTAKKTNKWVLNKAGVKRELLDTVKARISDSEVTFGPMTRPATLNSSATSSSNSTDFSSSSSISVRR